MSKLWEWRSKLWFFQKSCMDWELDHKAGWVPKNWYFWNGVLEKTLESPSDSSKIKPIKPKGSQPWIFIGRTDAEAELQYFGHLMQRADSLENTLMMEKTEDRRRRGQRRVRWLDDIIDSMEMSLSNSRWWWWTEKPGVLQFIGLQRVRPDLGT